MFGMLFSWPSPGRKKTTTTTTASSSSLRLSSALSHKLHFYNDTLPAWRCPAWRGLCQNGVKNMSKVCLSILELSSSMAYSVFCVNCTFMLCSELAFWPVQVSRQGNCQPPHLSTDPATLVKLAGPKLFMDNCCCFWARVTVKIVASSSAIISIVVVVFLVFSFSVSLYVFVSVFVCCLQRMFFMERHSHTSAAHFHLSCLLWDKRQIHIIRDVICCRKLH